MKLQHFLLALGFTVILFSCKKDKDDAPTIVGFWKGKYSNNSTTYPTLGYAFLFRNDGTVRVFNNLDTTTGSKAEGTYSVTGSTITTTYKYTTTNLQYSTTATVDPKFTFIEGTWGNGTNTTNGGLFFVNKQ